MIGLLCAHGTAALLQVPMLGYWLAFPSLLVIFSRSWRIVRRFMSIPATTRVLDSETMEFTCKHPKGKDWRYSAGQYVLLQVPKISWFQWHPFTISSCRGNVLQLHVKLDGDWTNAVRDASAENNQLRVGIDGPFGAPAQRFYDYDYSIIVGGGIGITPFSAILTDLEENFRTERDPWAERRRSRSLSRPGSRRSSKAPSESEQGDISSLPKVANPDRRVDFHWTVREKNHLLWFSDLLNRAISGAYPLAKNGNLELNINTHITAKRKNISTHIFRYLLDSYRTNAAPYSALTGLKQPSHFGRPDFDLILEKHFDELVEAGVSEKKVGVFYCGAPVVGEILADRCHVLTVKARALGLKIRYDFLIEVFG
jgi:respiratory burst oxidase